MNNESVNEEKLKKIEDIYARLDRMNYYELLSIRRKAEPHQIKAGYRKQVRELHPDNFGRDIDDELKDKLEKIFNALNEAYNTLTNQEQKLKYDQELFSAEAKGLHVKSGKPIKVAHAQYNKGLDCLKNKNITTAINFFESAVALNPENPEYFAKLALAQMSHPKWRKDALTNIDQAIKINNENVNYHTLRGRICQKMGNLVDARSSYKKALAWDPNNRIARKGVNEISQALKKEKKSIAISLKHFLKKTFVPQPKSKKNRKKPKPAGYVPKSRPAHLPNHPPKRSDDKNDAS